MKPDHDIDYFVADFGKDKDLRHSDASIAYAEEKLGHKWDWKKAGKKAKEVIYNDQRPMDSDIATTQANMKEAVGQYGVWDLPKGDWFVQLDAKTESDPICNSQGCTQYLFPHDDHPKDYYVPDLGRDKEMRTSGNSLKWAED